MKLAKSFSKVNQDEWDSRAELFKNRHPVIVRGNTKESAMSEVENNRALFVSLLEPKPTDTLLEVGCGNGLYLQHFAPLVSRAVGLDLSLNMLKLARCDRRVHLTQGSAHVLPFADASIDKLLNNAMLEYLPADVLPNFFREVHRVLKPNGLALISEFPLRWCLYGIRNRLIDIARNVKRRIQGRNPCLYQRYTPSGCAHAIEQAELRIVKHATHQYASAFLPVSLSRRITKRCYNRGTYSQMFSSYYLFLLTRDEH